MTEPRPDAASQLRVISAAELPAREREYHERFMQRTLALARSATGSPFAAVIVARESGEIVSEGTNRAGENRVLHAEMVALLNGGEPLPAVDGALTLYASAEPCPMCAAAMVWAGIARLVYATSLDTLVRIRVRQIHIDSERVAGAAGDFPLGNGSIVSGVLETEADAIYERWANQRAPATR